MSVTATVISRQSSYALKGNNFYITRKTNIIIFCKIHDYMPFFMFM